MGIRTCKRAKATGQSRCDGQAGEQRNSCLENLQQYKPETWEKARLLGAGFFLSFFFFSPLLFPPFSLHTVQMKTLVIFSKGKCLRKQVEFKRHCRTALPTLLQTFPEQLLCPLISSELQSGFA